MNYGSIRLLMQSLTTNGILLLILIKYFFVIPLNAMQMVQKKIVLRKVELRSLRQLMLKERVLITLMQINGTECMRLIKAPHDLINFNNAYLDKCYQDIDEYAGIVYPSGIPKDPPAAAPLNIIVDYAFEKKRLDILRIIVERYYATKQWPALCLLARGGYTKACEILLGLNYVDVNCVDHMLRTPLMNAAMNGKANVVALLLKRKDVNLLHQDRCRKDASRLAQENKHKSVVVLLEEALQNKKT